MREGIILLIEDNEDDQDLTKMALAESGVRNKIIIVDDGAKAIAYLTELCSDGGAASNDLPAVVLLDLNLPKVSGLEVLQWIRKNERTKYLPVVILTSSREDKDMASGYESGCNSYIRKPVDFDQFHDALRQMGVYWLVLNETVNTMSG